MPSVLPPYRHNDTPICPICGASMVVRPTSQFRYADGSDETVHDCEKCRAVSTTWSIRGSQHGSNTPRQNER